MRRTFGIPVYFDTDKLIKHIHQKQDMGADNHMTVQPEYIEIKYDGAFLPVDDATARYDRDKDIKQKYREAEKNVDMDQLTWDDVEKSLSNL